MEAVASNGRASLRRFASCTVPREDCVRNRSASRPVPPVMTSWRTTWPAAAIAVAAASVLTFVLLARPDRSGQPDQGGKGASPAVDPQAVYDPVAAGEPLPRGYARIFGRRVHFPHGRVWGG